ncbi:MAG: hypothetical protein ABSH08_18200, partial [Tepidisphaeraceae bacterium]
GAIELGIPGIIAAGLIAGCILAYINTVRSHANLALRVLCAVLCGCTWTQQALHTTLLSSGIALFCVLLLVVPKIQKHQYLVVSQVRRSRRAGANRG